MNSKVPVDYSKTTKIQPYSLQLTLPLSLSLFHIYLYIHLCTLFWIAKGESHASTILSTSQKMATPYGHIPNPDQTGAGLYSFKLTPASSLFLFSLAFFLLLTILCWVRRKCTMIIEKPAKFSTVRKIKKRTTTPVSILDVKVMLPSIIIFRDEADMKNRYDPFEFAHVPAVRLGKGTLGPLYKVVLNNGSIVTVRKLQAGLAKPDEINRWIKFFGGIRDKWLSRIMFSFWYGGESFIVYEYMCLGSLEELLHGEKNSISPWPCLFMFF